MSEGAVSDVGAMTYDVARPHRSAFTQAMIGPVFRLARWLDDYGVYRYRRRRHVAWWLAARLWRVWNRMLKGSLK